jgi:hypothetical protein
MEVSIHIPGEERVLLTVGNVKPPTDMHIEGSNHGLQFHRN